MPKQKLTDRLVRTAKPDPTRRVRYWDEAIGCHGLCLQIEPSGSRSWQLLYRRKGKPKWYRLESVGRLGLADAREAARKLNLRLVNEPEFDPMEARKQDRIDAVVKPRRVTTFNQLMDRYLDERARPHLKSAAGYEKLLGTYVRPHLGALPVEEMTRGDVRQMVRQITNKGTPSAANQALGMVNIIFNWAIKEEGIQRTDNPAARMGRNKTKSRQRILTNDEIPLFWDAFGDLGAHYERQGMALRLMMLTGQRQGESCHMRWQDLEIGDHLLTDNDGKEYVTHGG